MNEKSREEGERPEAEEEDNVGVTSNSDSDFESAYIIEKGLIGSDTVPDTLDVENSSLHESRRITRSESRKAGPTSSKEELDAHRDRSRSGSKGGRDEVVVPPPTPPSQGPTSLAEDPAIAGMMEVEDQDTLQERDESKEKRGRGRPPSRGEYLHLVRETKKKEQAEERKKEEVRMICDPSVPAPPKKNKGLLELQDQAKHELLGVSPEVVMSRLLESINTVNKMVALSSNLQGGVKKTMGEATVQIETCCNELAKRVAEADGQGPVAAEQNNSLR